MWPIRIEHDSFICCMPYLCVIWRIHTWHDSFIRDTTHSYVTWRVYLGRVWFIWDMTRSCGTWLVHMWHDSLICDMTHCGCEHTATSHCRMRLWVWVTWLIHVWQNSFYIIILYVKCMIIYYMNVTWLIYMRYTCEQTERGRKSRIKRAGTYT